VGPPVPIDDAGDARLDDYRGLRRPDQRSRAEGFFIAEGATVLERLLDAPHRIRSVVLTPARVARFAARLASVPAPLYVVTPEVLTEVVGYDLHRGVIASATRPAPAPLADVIARARTIVVLEGLNDFENLGAIARSARALGADALVLDPLTADPLARRAVRVSMGEVLFLPTVRLDNWPAGLRALRDAGFRLVAMTPAAAAIDLFGIRREAGERIAVMLGAEGPGLTPAALELADVRARIPLRAGVDSLNVGHAAAIALAHLGHPS
jgi:tRNA G18 (ribose-2'-O)-methylase SpoU